MAYSLFSEKLAQSISYDQFDQYIKDMESRWGKIASEKTALMPLHQRVGENLFVPAGLSAERIQRYTFEVPLDHGSINCDMTVVLKDSRYKIYWLTFWGNDIELFPEIQKKV